MTASYLLVIDGLRDEWNLRKTLPAVSEGVKLLHVLAEFLQCEVATIAIGCMSTKEQRFHPKRSGHRGTKIREVVQASRRMYYVHIHINLHICVIAVTE